MIGHTKFRTVRIAGVLVLLAAIAILPLASVARADIGRRDGDISAPVVYKDLMLVFATKDGASAVVFYEETEHGVLYKFRYESRDGKTKLDGKGKVYEQRDDDGSIGGAVFIITGPIRVGWSFGGEGRGWIYYNPDKVRVSIAKAKSFDNRVVKGPIREHFYKKLDLKRFMTPLK